LLVLSFLYLPEDREDEAAIGAAEVVVEREKWFRE